MDDLVSAYFDICVSQLSTAARLERSNIDAAARLVAQALEDDRGYFLFGSGHSTFIAKEAYWRAGGLAPALPIPDPLSGDAERISDFAPILLAHYDLRAGDMIIVISNSGINPLPIEIALECQARGMDVIAITCVAHSKAVASRHPGGKKLMDVADVVIDTHGEAGDATLGLPGSEWRVGPTSTVLGAAIVQAITVGAASILQASGIEPPVIVSANVPGGDEHNRELARRYRGRLVRYEVPTVDVYHGQGTEESADCGLLNRR